MSFTATAFRAWVSLAGGLGALGLAMACQFAAAEPQNLGGPVEKVQIPGVVRELGPRLAAIDRLANDQHWQEAIDAYLELLREHGDDLVPIDPSSDPLSSCQHFVQARWFIHNKIASLGPTAWKACRNRIGGKAHQLFEAAAPQRDVALLRRIVEDVFCATAAGPALELLGDLAFERGDFAEAQHWWRLLARPASEPADAGKHRPLLFPDAPDTAAIRVRAKQIVTLLFLEQADLVPGELQAFRRDHGQAKGMIAGKQGVFADILEALHRDWTVSTATEVEWPTFGGDPSRNRAMPQELAAKLWSDGPAWRVRLDTGEKVMESVAGKGPSGQESARQLAFHPIVVGGAAYVTDGRHVRGFDVRNGRVVFHYDLLDGREVAGSDEFANKYPPTPDLRFTLTAADGHLFARLGGYWIGPAREADKRTAASWLVCLKLPDRGANTEDKPPAVERWAVRPVGKDGEDIQFEGTPLVHGKSAYVVQSRLRGSHTVASVCCLDVNTGAIRWEQDLIDAPEFGEFQTARCRHHLLTLAGPYLVYNSHAGAVVAIDAATGKRVWAVAYPSRGPRAAGGWQSPRELCPPLAAGPQVFLAPGDLDRLLCLDIATGCRVWERESLEIVHLLAVTSGRLVFTTPQGLRAVGASTGDDRGGWCQPTVGTLSSQGRPLLAGGWVFWPTQDPKLAWRALNVADGSLHRSGLGYDAGTLRTLPPGNVVFGRGCLLIATTEELWGYVMPAPAIGPPRT